MMKDRVEIEEVKKQNTNSPNTIKKRSKRLDELKEFVELKKLPNSVKFGLKSKSITVVLRYETLLFLDLYINYSESLVPSLKGKIHNGSIIDGLIESLKNEQNFKDFSKNFFPEIFEYLF